MCVKENIHLLIIASDFKHIKVTICMNEILIDEHSKFQMEEADARI
jgi:hypothetical protein